MGLKKEGKVLNALIPNDIYDKLQKEANKCYTSIAAITRIILKEHFEEKSKKNEQL